MAHSDDVLNAAGVYSLVWAGSDLGDFFAEYAKGNLDAVGHHLKDWSSPGFVDS